MLAIPLALTIENHGRSTSTAETDPVTPMVTLKLPDIGFAPRHLTPAGGHRRRPCFPRSLPLAASRTRRPSVFFLRRTRARGPSGHKVGADEPRISLAGQGGALSGERARRADEGQRGGMRRKRRHRGVRRTHRPRREETAVFVVVDGEVKKPSPLEGGRNGLRAGDRLLVFHLQEP